MTQLGKILVFAGLAMVVVGLGFLLAERLGLGRLPGDLVWRGEKFTVHLPIATSIVLSVVLTVLLNWWLRR